MPDRTPAETLTAAAKALRAAFNSIPPTDLDDLPWHVEECADEATGNCACIVAQGRQADGRAQAYIADAETPELAAYIALMHPGVGLALAAWLGQAARAHRAAETAARRVWREDGDDHSRASFIADRTDQHALAVARLLLGEAAR